MSDDAERLRIESDRRRAGRAVPPPEGTRSVVAVTKAVTSYPTAAGKFFACETQTLLGTESEGSPGALTGRGDTVYAYLPAGAPVPAVGSTVILVGTDYRWTIDL